jgi:hypothetical protein
VESIGKELDSMSNAATAAVAAPHHASAPIHVVTAPAAARVSEETRWLLGFGVPCLAASLFVAAAIGAGNKWLMAGALGFLLTAIVTLTWLAISSDTNAHA